MPKHWFKARTCLNERPCWAVKSPTPLNTYSSTVSVHSDSRKQQGRTPTGQNWQCTLGRLNGNTCCSNPSLAFDLCRLQTSYHGPWEMAQWIKCWLWKSEDLSLDHQDPCKKKTKWDSLWMLFQSFKVRPGGSWSLTDKQSNQSISSRFKERTRPTTEGREWKRKILNLDLWSPRLPV